MVPTDYDNDYCGTMSLGKRIEFDQNQLNYARSTNEKYTFNVYFHYIDNVVPQNEQEDKAQDMIGVLNLYFNEADIYFKYRGYENINDASYRSISGNNVEDLSSTYDIDNNINIYICENFVDNQGNPTSYTGNTWTWTNISGDVVKKIITIRVDYIPEYNNANPTLDELKLHTLVHEMGHYMGLYHTHQMWKYDNNGNLITVKDTYSGCDRIEENLDNSESTIYGDLLSDTNPDRVRKRYWNGSNYYSNCTVSWNHYTGDANCNRSIDQNMFDPPMDNIMAYYHQCRSGFSMGQYARMRAIIAQEINGGFLSGQRTTEISLYEPYEVNVEVDYDWVLSETDNGNGTTTICYGSKLVHKFQKGFDYEFYHHNGNNNYSLEYNSPKYERPIDEGPQRAVKIPALDASLIYLYDDTAGIRPDPTANCVTARPVGGKVITKDVNGTVIEQRNLNASEASDPNLIQTLENNKVHRIEKDLDNGKKSVKTIYKTQP